LKGRVRGLVGRGLKKSFPVTQSAKMLDPPLEAMTLNQDGIWNTETVCNASGIFHSVTNFQFIVCLTVVSHCLEATRPLTKQLQSSTFDVVAANEKVAFFIQPFSGCDLKGHIVMSSGIVRLKAWFNL